MKSLEKFLFTAYILIALVVELYVKQVDF